jgi:hypothetical protein
MKEGGCGSSATLAVGKSALSNVTTSVEGCLCVCCVGQRAKVSALESGLQVFLSGVTGDMRSELPVQGRHGTSTPEPEPEEALPPAPAAALAPAVAPPSEQEAGVGTSAGRAP